VSRRRTLANGAAWFERPAPGATELPLDFFFFRRWPPLDNTGAVDLRPGRGVFQPQRLLTVAAPLVGTPLLAGQHHRGESARQSPAFSLRDRGSRPALRPADALERADSRHAGAWRRSCPVVIKFLRA